MHDVRQVIPKFVRKDINLVDFPKAAWVLNDAYRQMHSAAVTNAEGTTTATVPGSASSSTAAAPPSAEDAALAKKSNKVLTPTK